MNEIIPQVKNGAIMHFNDGTMAVVDINCDNLPPSSRMHPTNWGTNFDGATEYKSIRKPGYRIDIDNYRNKLANSNPEARRQMSNVLKKSRGNFANLSK